MLQSLSLILSNFDLLIFSFVLILIRLKTVKPSWFGLENTLTVSLQKGKTFPMSVLDMTLNC